MSAMIPEGWIKASLSEVVTVNPKHTDLEDQVAGFVPMALAPTDFNGTLNYEERQWNDIKKGYTHFATGDIIFAKVTPCFENGKAAIVKDMPNGIGAGSTEFYVLRPLLDSISSDYIFSVIKSYEFLQTGAENMTGAVGLRRVPKKFVEDFKINLPPLTEQKVIADKLDELLAQVESTKARLDAIPAILKSFRQSVLAAAVSGKLTEEWREDAGLSAWSEKLLSEVASNIVDCPHSTPKWSNAGKYCVRTTAFNPFFLDLTNQGFVSEKVYADRIQRLKPESKDILYSREGTVGIACQIPADVELCLGQRMVLIRAGKEVSSRFLTMVLNSEKILSIVQSKTIGSTAPRVNMKDIRAYPIPIPSRNEQTEIVRRVEALFAFADKVEAQVNAAQSRVNNLTQSILAKAFRGELTEPWRKDNPELITGKNSAEALLKRIKAERDVLATKKKPEKKTSVKKAALK